MHWILWVLALLCAGLTAALAFALQKLFARADEEPAVRLADKLPEGWQKLDELLSMLLTLQEQGVSHSGAVSREDFGRAVLDASCRLMNCGRGSVMMFDEAAGSLKVVAVKSPSNPNASKMVFKPGEGVAGKAFATGAAIYVEDPQNDPRYVNAAAGDTQPFISIPLLVKSKPIGVLNLHADGAIEPFNDYNVKFLNILAGEAAVMLHNLDLFDRLETFYLEMVKTLARAVDSKDQYTHEHSDRASARARRLAKHMNVPDAEARYIEYAALLHDIGKIGIDEAILLKPGKLTPEEYEQMKKHPVIGHQILAPVKFLGPVAQMVLYHQEWYDGRGYPEGLKGEAIPLGARMVAVIDAWDAMTSDRPYRKALGRELATEQLRKGAGTQFDPQVVEAFLRLEAQDRENGAGKAGAGGHPEHAH